MNLRKTLLAATLPRHAMHAVGWIEMVGEVASAPTTPVALVVLLLSGLLWWWRSRWSGLARAAGRWEPLAGGRTGVDGVAGRGGRMVVLAAARVQRLHTGQLNWNLAAMVVGLLLVLVYALWLGGGGW